MKTKADQDRTQLQQYLKSLGPGELDEILNDVLAEMRNRESEQVKRDILTHSQKLRLGRMKP